MSPLAVVLALPVRLYRRWLSPALPPHCRFSPTCSAYALEALRTRGALVGSALLLRRLGRCHPWHPGGLDPVPAPRAAHAGAPPGATGAARGAAAAPTPSRTLPQAGAPS